MSDILNDDDKGALAAEFVLGTLDAPERAGAQQVLTSDRSFIAMVKIRERRFGELHLMVEPVEPDRSSGIGSGGGSWPMEAVRRRPLRFRRGPVLLPFHRQRLRLRWPRGLPRWRRKGRL